MNLINFKDRLDISISSNLELGYINLEKLLIING
jgi:hypothetical protein